MADNTADHDLEQAARAEDSPGGEEVTPGEAVEQEVARHSGTWDDARQEAAHRD
jgi:hypothetical protein